MAANVSAALLNAHAGTVALRPTPILTTTLPTNTTYQVESSADGNTWQATSVLVAGTGLPIALRLDGFSESLTYRFSRIGAADFIVPTITNGWHVSGSFPNVGEVRIQTSSTLTPDSWEHLDFVFPDSAGAFVWAWRPPWSSPTFFRGLQPAEPLELVTLGSYSADPNVGYSGFGVVADDMPQLYRDGFICAPCPAFYHRGSSAAAAGECYEFAGPFGTATVMVGDISLTPPPNTCDTGKPFFDISESAFAALFKEPAGWATATYRLVPAPVEGNLKMVVVQSAAPFYVELRPYNHRAGVSKLEIQNAGSATWTELPRTDYNSFVFSGGVLTFPVNVRVTSRFGEVVQFPPIASMNMNQRFAATAQFTNFPSQSPTPVWIQSPVYSDSLSNMLGSVWTTSAYGGAAVNPNYTGNAYEGTASLRISGLAGFSSVNFTYPHSFPRTTDGFLEFAIRSGNAAAVENLAIVFVGSDSGGNTVNSAPVKFPALNATWQLMRIPLSPALAPERLVQFRIYNDSSVPIESVLLDSIKFSHP